MTMFGAAPNGASAGERRGGFAAITPQAWSWTRPTWTCCLGTWRCSCAWASPGTAPGPLLGFILSLIFGFFFLAGSATATDQRLAEVTGSPGTA